MGSPAGRPGVILGLPDAAERHLDARPLRHQTVAMSIVTPPTPPRLTDRFPQMPPAACRVVLETLLAAQDDEARAVATTRLLEHQPVLNYEYEAGQTFWRARRMEGETPYTHEREMLWPPMASGQGRAHRPGTPMLYVAAKRDTALAECDARREEMFQLVGVRIQANTRARLIPLGELFHVQRTGISLTGSTERARTIDGLLNASSRGSAEGIVYVDAWLDDEFSKSGQHDLTGLLAECLFAKAAMPDGILYLSVKQKGGRNVAIRPAAFSERWHVVSSSVVRVREVLGFGMFALEYMAHADGIFVDGRFRWETGTPSQNSHIEWR
jgi:hypothetical protein